MKKRSFQKSMLMGNTAVVTLVVVVLFIWRESISDSRGRKAYPATD